MDPLGLFYPTSCVKYVIVNYLLFILINGYETINENSIFDGILKSKSINLMIYFKAMNRSLTSVILGGFGNKPVKSSELTAIAGVHTETNIDQVANLMINSKNIIITPGELKKNI